MSIIKTIIFIIPLLLPSVFLQAQTSEASKKGYLQVDMDIYSRIRYNHLGGSTFQLGNNSLIDSGGFSFLSHLPTKNADIDIKVGLKFEDRDEANRQQLNFDEAYIRVNNLFDVMDIKFFDIGYGAGHGYSIRPDLKVRGAQFYFRPISKLTLSLGYGIASDELQLYPVSNGLQSQLNGQSTTYFPNYHAIKFDLLYDNLYVPFSFYYGIALVDNNSTYLAQDYLPSFIDDKILHSSVGFSLDLLAFYRRGAMAFDVGFGLPLGAMSRFINLNGSRDYSYDNELNFLFQFYGDVDIAHGFGLKYQLLFALDTHTKQKALGNLYDEYFKESFKLALASRYTYGSIRYDVGFMVGIVGGKTARNSYDRKDNMVFNKNTVYNNFVFEAGIDWTPFPFKGLGKNFTVRGYYKVDLGDLDNSGDHYNEIGMNLKLSFDTRDID